MNRRTALTLTGAVVAALFAFGSARPALAQTLTQNQQLAFDIFKELVEINTVSATGDTAHAAAAMAARLRAAGFSGDDLQVFTPAPRKGNLIARLRGTGPRKPILLLAHLDVVEALRADWSSDPFRLIEKDGYYYGRGTEDDKYMAATFVADLIRYRLEGFRPDRDIILALTADEEIGDRDALGVRWLIKYHRDLIDAEFALNEGGNIDLKGGAPIRSSIQTSEKFVQTYQLEATNRGGHSSVPRADNAIYQLAAALTRLGGFRFPVNLNPTTRAYFERAAELETPQTAADISSVLSSSPDPTALARVSENAEYNAQLRTTCVATRLEGGHADNALPQTARATVNCRIMPAEKVEDVKETLERVLGDDRISLRPINSGLPTSPSALNKELLSAIEKTTAEFWPGTPIVPVMFPAATDGRYLRNAGIPTYGHSGLAGDVDDERAHGKDERVAVKSFHEGGEYLYRLVKRLSGGN